MKTEIHTDWIDRLVCKCGGSRYMKRENRLNMGFLLSFIVWALCKELSDILIERGAVAGGWAWLVVLLTIPVAAWIIYRYYRLYSGVDELTRKLMANALSISAGIVIFIAMTFAALRDVGVWQPPFAATYALFAAIYIVVSSVLSARMKQ